MFNRAVLTTRVVNILLKQEFEVLLTKGCFDIAAKREKLILVKPMLNVDGFNGEAAQSLKTVAYFMSAYPFVVSMKNNRGFLDDDVVYTRFGLPVVTPKMFEDILDEEAYSSLSAKGRHSIEIDVDAMREKRNEMEFTLDELSDLVGVSKKALYEIENRRTNPMENTVKKLERILKLDLRKIYKPSEVEKTYSNPANTMQKKVSMELRRMGTENSPVQHAPFEIVGKEKFSFIAGISQDRKKIVKGAVVMKKLSGMFSSSAFFVAKKTEKKNVEGVPVILEDELPEIETSKELKKLIEESSE